MYSLVYKAKTDKVITINTQAQYETPDNELHCFASGFSHPSIKMAEWFQGKLYKAVLNTTTGDCNIYSVDSDLTETLVISAGQKDWKSAFFLNLSDIHLLVALQTSVDFTYYLYDGTQSNQFTASKGGTRIWDVLYLNGKLYFALDTDILEAFPGSVPQPLNLNDNLRGATLFPFGNTIYSVFPMLSSLMRMNSNKRFDLVYKVDGLTTSTIQASSRVVGGKVYFILPHFYGKMMFEYDGNVVKSMDLPYDLMSRGNDSSLYYDGERLYVFSYSNLSGGMCWRVIPMHSDPVCIDDNGQLGWSKI